MVNIEIPSKVFKISTPLHITPPHPHEKLHTLFSGCFTLLFGIFHGFLLYFVPIVPKKIHNFSKIGLKYLKNVKNDLPRVKISPKHLFLALKTLKIISFPFPNLLNPSLPTVQSLTSFTNGLVNPLLLSVANHETIFIPGW